MPRGAGRRPKQGDGPRQIEINQFSARRTDRVVVTISLAIVAAGALAKRDFAHQPLLRQVTQRVVDGRKANARQIFAGRFKDFRRRRVMVSGLHGIEYYPPLPRKTPRNRVLILCLRSAHGLEL